ncbi:hypothetical protein LPB137_00510 [Poseidonibacter parvus]|uniref:Transposase IS30-like HTH domain-containing protein n=1 Tax=Poseidonibacter parvus TaxID=1850254 RepID=A0A1P8KIN9_9BACT|nr:IS30 family transposase [Poseidonibacter parvus]APW64418.1 hypothetical protein LPB137_00510 [Poseidonibacter parvus]
MKKFTQLPLKERYQISAYIKVGYTQNDIAKILDKSQSTISREISRDSKYNKYQAEVSEQLTFTRHNKKNKFVKLTKKVKIYIQEKLKLDWSPEQISGVMKKQKLSYTVSYETIYQYIYHNKSCGGRLYFKLRHKNKKYHKRSNDYNTRGIIKNRISIDKRPKVVEKESRTEIVNIQNRLNNRPRKVLGYKTPNEIFFKILQRKLAA